MFVRVFWGDRGEWGPSHMCVVNQILFIGTEISVSYCAFLLAHSCLMSQLIIKSPVSFTPLLEVPPGFSGITRTAHIYSPMTKFALRLTSGRFHEAL